jgi:hypothetical protein
MQNWEKEQKSSYKWERMERRVILTEDEARGGSKVPLWKERSGL